jgi:hypothetical protein
VLIAVLHIVLGITKKIFDENVNELQEIDNEDTANERRGLTDVRDALLDEIETFKLSWDGFNSEEKEASDTKAKAWKNLQDAMKELPQDNEKIVSLRSQHKKAIDDLKYCKEVVGDNVGPVREQHLALEQMVGDMNTYLKRSQGRYEACVENTTSQAPINVQHNPFYDGAFNGSDCFRLMEKNHIMFYRLLDVAASEVDDTMKAKVSDAIQCYRDIFEAWAEVLPLFRSPKLLPLEDRMKLLADIDTFVELFIKHTRKGSITLKIHHLMDHVKKPLEETGTVGFWAEDAVESIHAIVNSLARRYASLNNKKENPTNPQST